MINQETPYKTLPSASKKAWRIHNGIWALIIWLVPLGLGVLLFLEQYVPIWIFVASLGLALLLTILLLVIIPNIRWRLWRYHIDKHEIDLEHGIFIIRRTLIPIKRVQHVDTRQGPVLRSYELADVVISTAATTHKIPALNESTANQVRSEISTFARKAKEDV